MPGQGDRRSEPQQHQPGRRMPLAFRHSQAASMPNWPAEPGEFDLLIASVQTVLDGEPKSAVLGPGPAEGARSGRIGSVKSNTTQTRPKQGLTHFCQDKSKRESNNLLRRPQWRRLTAFLMLLIVVAACSIGQLPYQCKISRTSCHMANLIPQASRCQAFGGLPYCHFET